MGHGARAEHYARARSGHGRPVREDVLPAHQVGTRPAGRVAAHVDDELVRRAPMEVVLHGRADRVAPGRGELVGAALERGGRPIPEVPGVCVRKETALSLDTEGHRERGASVPGGDLDVGDEGGVQIEHPRLLRPDVDLPACDRRGGRDGPPGGQLGHWGPGGRVEDVDRLVRGDEEQVVEVERGRVAARRARGEAVLPEEGPGPGIERERSAVHELSVDHGVGRDDIEDPVRVGVRGVAVIAPSRGRPLGRATDLRLPRERHIGLVEHVEVAVLVLARDQRNAAGRGEDGRCDPKSPSPVTWAVGTWNSALYRRVVALSAMIASL